MSLQIGQYRIVSELGAGGMGVVYKAVDVQINREVALKRLRSEFAASPAVLERFRREAQLQGRLNHPGIAQLYALAQTEEAFCIVMEFVDGVNLSKLLPLEWPYAIQAMLQVLDALQFAHDSGVLHRDIKPENMILDRRGVIKVMDFGIAHAVGAERMTREKSLIGTIEYMSPERILSQPIDGRSDLYAVGIVFFEVLAGRLPSDTASEYDLLRWHVETPAPPVTQFVDVPPWLAEVVARSIAKKPEDRYASCAEMAATLREYVRISGVQLPKLVTLVQRLHNEKVMSAEELHQSFTAARRYIDQEDLNSAQRYLADVVRDNPGNPPLENLHALVRAARLPSTRLQGTEADDSDGVSLQLLRVISAEYCGDDQAAGEVLHQALTANPEARLLRVLAAHRAQQGQPETART
jgi:serine/threonine protein kinase